MTFGHVVRFDAALEQRTTQGLSFPIPTAFCRGQRPNLQFGVKKLELEPMKSARFSGRTRLPSAVLRPTCLHPWMLTSPSSLPSHAKATLSRFDVAVPRISQCFPLLRIFSAQRR